MKGTIIKLLLAVTILGAHLATAAAEEMISVYQTAMGTDERLTLTGTVKFAPAMQPDVRATGISCTGWRRVTSAPISGLRGAR